MRILVVDDDARLLAEVKDVLTRHGHLVETSDNAEAALSLVRNALYDCVLVDYRMPDHDGVWFMNQAKLPRQTVALLVTSFLDRTAIRTMFAAGASGYVIKPFDEEELVRNLEFHMERRTAAQPAASSGPS